MIVDASAFLSIFLQEEDAVLMLKKMNASDHRLMSAATLVEVCQHVARKFGEEAKPLIEETLADLDIKVVAFTVEQAWLTLEAQLSFGKGFHPAKLNFGDCMVYALAKETGEPLLFKGNDFGQTDLLLA